MVAMLPFGLIYLGLNAAIGRTATVLLAVSASILFVSAILATALIFRSQLRKRVIGMLVKAVQALLHRDISDPLERFDQTMDRGVEAMREHPSRVAIIAGLIVAKQFHWPRLDGIIGLLVSLWLLYLGYDHGGEAIIPLLGKAPSKEMTDRIREIGRSVDGVIDVHEIIIHDYGSMYLISLHVEVPEKMGPIAMHEIAERCEHELRQVYGGAVVCHTDPLMEKTPEIEALENRFKSLVAAAPAIQGYHDFRVVAESETRIIIVADIDAENHIPEKDYESLTSDLESRVKAEIPHVAYCSFYVTPKFSY